MPVVAPQLLADMGDELLDRAGRIDLQAQRHHSREHADGALEIGGRPVEDRHADGDVVALRRSRQQRRQQCREHVERRCAARAAGIDELDVARPVHPELHRARRHVVVARALAASRREDRLRQGAKPLAPIVDVAAVPRRHEVRRVLGDEAAIGEELGRIRRSVAQDRAIGVCDRADHQRDAETVDDQMVIADEQQPLPFPRFRQREVEQRHVTVEDAHECRVDEIEKRRFGIGFVREVDDLDRRFEAGIDGLLRLIGMDAQAQRVVSCHGERDGAAEDRGVDGAGDSEVAADDVEARIGAGLQVEPHRHLGRGQLLPLDLGCGTRCAVHRTLEPCRSAYVTRLRVGENRRRSNGLRLPSALCNRAASRGGSRPLAPTDELHGG